MPVLQDVGVSWQNAHSQTNAGTGRREIAENGESQGRSGVAGGGEVASDRVELSAEARSSSAARNAIRAQEAALLTQDKPAEAEEHAATTPERVESEAEASSGVSGSDRAGEVLQSKEAAAAGSSASSAAGGSVTPETDSVRTVAAAGNTGAVSVATQSISWSVSLSTTTSTAQATPASSQTLLQQGMDMYAGWLRQQMQQLRTNATGSQDNSAAISAATSGALFGSVQGKSALTLPASSQGASTVGSGLSSLIPSVGGTQKGNQAWMNDLSGEMYKMVVLMAAMFDDPEARERALESMRSMTSAMSGISGGTAQTAVAQPGAAAATSQVTSSASMQVSVQFDYEALAVDLRGAGAAEYNAQMIRLAQSVSATMQCDPLVLDIAGDGINLTSAREGVMFDLTGDGTKEQAAFVQGDDALLFLDQNGNGRADNGKELFGDQEGDANGYAELARYDGNADGQIDAADAIYGQLRLWQDRNADGVCQQGETSGLADLDVQTISLAYGAGSGADGKGNAIAQSGSFTRSDGSVGQAADAMLGYLE